MDRKTQSKMLSTGDFCPCCGQPIRTKDPEILELLTLIKRDPAFWSIAGRAIDEIKQKREMRS